MRIVVQDGSLTLVQGGAILATSPAVAEDYPDYRRILHVGGAAATRPELSITALRAAMAQAGPDAADGGLITLGGAGLLKATERWPRHGSVSVNAEFLWDALDSVSQGWVQLPIEGQIAPLQIRDTDGDVRVLVMPVRTPEQAQGPR